MISLDSIRSDKTAQIKVGTAILALIIAGGLLIYQFTGGPPRTVDLKNPAVDFIHEVTNAFPYEAFPNVTFSVSEDGTSVNVRGMVASEAEKADLEKRLLAAQPTYPYSVEVKVKTR